MRHIEVNISLTRLLAKGGLGFASLVSNLGATPPSRLAVLRSVERWVQSLKFAPMLQRPLSFQPNSCQVIMALTVIVLAANFAHRVCDSSQNMVERLKAELSLTVSQNATTEHSSSGGVLNFANRIDVWPSRTIIDVVIKQANREALRGGVVIRSLSVTHQVAGGSSLGKVSLDVLTVGPYPASKAWQAALMSEYPSLTVQNLRVQTTPGSLGGLETRWTWALYVRD